MKRNKMDKNERNNMLRILFTLIGVVFFFLNAEPVELVKAYPIVSLVVFILLLVLVTSNISLVNLIILLFVIIVSLLYLEESGLIIIDEELISAALPSDLESGQDDIKEDNLDLFSNLAIYSGCEPIDVYESLISHGYSVEVIECFSKQEQGLIVKVINTKPEEKSVVIYKSLGEFPVYDCREYDCIEDYCIFLRENGIEICYGEDCVDFYEEGYEVEHDSVVYPGDQAILCKRVNYYNDIYGNVNDNVYERLIKLYEDYGFIVKYRYDEDVSSIMPMKNWHEDLYFDPVLGKLGFYAESLSQIEESLWKVEYLVSCGMNVEGLKYIVFADELGIHESYGIKHFSGWKSDEVIIIGYYDYKTCEELDSFVEYVNK